MDTVTFTDASGNRRLLPWNDSTVEYLAELSYASELTVQLGNFNWKVQRGNWRVA